MNHSRRTALQDQVDAILASLFSTETSWTELGLPELIEIEPTNYCNLKCLMCHVSYQDFARERVDVNRLLRSLEGITGKWALLGAVYEPAAHPDFPALVRGLSDLGMKIDLTTNGTLLTRKTVDEIKGANFKIVTVSFDGVKKETYERIRRGARYDLTVERVGNFKSCLEAKDCCFQASYTVLRSNMAEISAAVDFWEDFDFDHLGFIMMVIRDDNDLLRQESPFPVEAYVLQQIEAVGRKIIDNNLRLGASSTYFHRTDLAREYPDNFFWPHCVISSNPKSRLFVNPRPRIQKGYFPGMAVECRSPFKLARILWNGDVQLCMQFTVGNILRDNLVDIWFGKAAERIRKLVLSRPEICYSCDYYRFCLNAAVVDTASPENTVSAVVGNRLLEFLQPSLLKSYPKVGYNIVGWLGEYYALPQALGPINLTEEDVSDRDGVIVSDSLNGLEGELESLLGCPVGSGRRHRIDKGKTKWTFESITSRLKTLLKPRRS